MEREREREYNVAGMKCKFVIAVANFAPVSVGLVNLLSATVYPLL